MTPAELQGYLYEQIPLSRAMEVTVIENGDRVILEAALKPNINHRGSVFGGSESSLALLAGWAWLRERVVPIYPDANLVVASSQMVYAKPVLGDFRATCLGGDAVRLFDHLERRGSARLSLTITLTEGDVVVATMEGVFAAVLPRPTSDSSRP